MQAHLFKPTGALLVTWKRKQNGCIPRHGCANMAHRMQTIDTAKTDGPAHERWKCNPQTHRMRWRQKRPPTKTRYGRHLHIHPTARGTPYIVPCTFQPHQRRRKGMRRQGPTKHAPLPSVQSKPMGNPRQFAKDSSAWCIKLRLSCPSCTRFPCPCSVCPQLRQDRSAWESSVCT